MRLYKCLVGRIRANLLETRLHLVTSDEFVSQCPEIFINRSEAVKATHRRKGSRSLLQPARLVSISVKASFTTVCIRPENRYKKEFSGREQLLT